MANLEERLQTSTSIVNKYTYDQLLKWNVDQRWAQMVNMLVLLALTVALVYLLQFTVRYLFRLLLRYFNRNNKRPFLTFLKERRFAHFLALIAPALVVKNAIPVVFDHYPGFIGPLNTLTNIFMVFMAIWIIISFLRAGADSIRRHPVFEEKPVGSYLQVIIISLYLLGAVVVYSQITGKSLTAFFGVMGAASAILLLIFKDTIMGFVASIQVTSNDMVHVGDWITMPNYNADGDVLEMNLTTVKVQNWDKTITMIPTYKLLADSFINWGGMVESGGRRIKKSIIIKQSSVRFLSAAELEALKKIQRIAPYIEERQAEIDMHNKRLQVDTAVPVNGRNMTNLGLFRKYTDAYLRHHPGVHQDKIIMVRQLAPSIEGLPLEVYAFTNTVKWVEYEPIVADIFDHLIAAVRYFDLEIFEIPTGRDIWKIKEGMQPVAGQA